MHRVLDRAHGVDARRPGWHRRAGRHRRSGEAPRDRRAGRQGDRPPILLGRRHGQAQPVTVPLLHALDAAPPSAGTSAALRTMAPTRPPSAATTPGHDQAAGGVRHERHRRRRARPLRCRPPPTPPPGRPSTWPGRPAVTRGRAGPRRADLRSRYGSRRSQKRAVAPPPWIRTTVTASGCPGRFAWRRRLVPARRLTRLPQVTPVDESGQAAPITGLSHVQL